MCNVNFFHIFHPLPIISQIPFEILSPSFLHPLHLYLNHQTLGGCVCSSGFAGADCSETVTPATGVWEVLSDVANLNISVSPVARMGHTMVHVPGYLLVYAGYSLAHGFLSDLLSFNLSTDTWTHIEVNQVPSQVPAARFLHSAVFYGVNNYNCKNQVSLAELFSPSVVHQQIKHE